MSGARRQRESKNGRGKKTQDPIRTSNMVQCSTIVHLISLGRSEHSLEGRQVGVKEGARTTKELQLQALVRSSNASQTATKTTRCVGIGIDTHTSRNFFDDKIADIQLLLGVHDKRAYICNAHIFREARNRANCVACELSCTHRVRDST